MFPHHHLLVTPNPPLFIGIPLGFTITPSGSRMMEAGVARKAREPP